MIDSWFIDEARKAVQKIYDFIEILKFYEYMLYDP